MCNKKKVCMCDLHIQNMQVTKTVHARTIMTMDFESHALYADPRVKTEVYFGL